MSTNKELKNFWQCSDDELAAAEKELREKGIESLSDQALFIIFTSAERNVKLERLMSYGKNEKYDLAVKKYNRYLAEVMKRGISH